jgi:hypothetical protein
MASNLIKAGEFPLTLSQFSQQNILAHCFKNQQLRYVTNREGVQGK